MANTVIQLTREKRMNINCIPNNMETYMAFRLGNNLKFIDSFIFMSSSLEQQVCNLPKDTLNTHLRFSKEKHPVWYAFTLMMIWIHLKSLRKPTYPVKYSFIASLMIKISAMMITSILNVFSKASSARIRVSIMICIYYASGHGMLQAGSRSLFH